MDIDLKRVVIHESGHFVAHMLNQSLYDLGEVDKIKIKRVEIDSQFFYGGSIILIKPPGLDLTKGVINLPQRLAVLVYGCFFQCIFLEKEFESCFDRFDNSKNGCSDHRFYFNALNQFDIPTGADIKLMSYIRDEYFPEIFRNKEEFDQIFNLDYNRVLSNEGDTFHVDLNQLKLLLGKFIENHKEQYKNFVETIKETIDWENVKKLQKQ